MADPLPDEGPDYSSGEESRPADPELVNSDDEGEDLMENVEADYRENTVLDRYENEGMDEDFEGEGDAAEAMAARRAAEAALAKRDKREGKRGRRALPGALEDDSDDDEYREKRKSRKRRKAEDAQADEPEGPLGVDLDSYSGPLPEFIAQEPVQREIARRFRMFLKTFQAEGSKASEQLYQYQIREMAKTNGQSLEVDFKHLSDTVPILAINLADCPRLMLEIFDRVALDVVLEAFPEFTQVHSQVFVRVFNLPIVDPLRNLRQYHLNLLIRTTGVVTRRTGVFPQLQQVKYDCAKCGYVMGPFYQNPEAGEVKPASCPTCQSMGPFLMNVQQTVYRNFQRITLQESPGDVPAGRLPRQKDIVLLNDLIDCARPGEEIEVIGVYTNQFDYALNVKSGFPVFSTVIEANCIKRRGDEDTAAKLTDEDKQDIHALARDPRVVQRIVKSMAPSIYGLDSVKLGLALSLFGGCEKHPSNTTRLRGDINMLMLGDPGTAKSQLLKYVEKVAARAVYTTGKGASAVGLTAAVQKDPITREWTLEGGALVLADRGACLIDEFDKMNEQDRVSIHEAMEQQTISISKAGIVTTLQARCSVLAAANPIGGRYDPSRTFAENVELSDPILSRFDILAVVRDVVDPVNDERLANFVVDSHMRSQPSAARGSAAQGEGEEGEDHMEEEARAKAADDDEVDPDIIPQELLRKYITYSKAHCRPKLHNADYDKIAQVYAELRREAAVTHSMPIAVRHLESVIRISEAHARMHLREHVTNDDIDTAIRTLLESFVASQKYSVQKALSRRFRRFLVDQRDFNGLMLNTLQGLVRDALRVEQLSGRVTDENNVAVPIKLLEERLREYAIGDVAPFLSSDSFSESGFRMDPSGRTILLSR